MSDVLTLACLLCIIYEVSAMKVNVSSLRNKLGASLQREAIVQSPVLDFQHVVESEVPVKTSVTVTNTENGFCVEMRVSFSVTLICTRCLAEHSKDLSNDTTEWFERVEEQTELDTRTELEAVLDQDTPTFAGDDLDLTGFAAESVLLAVPLRALCSEECRGLCSHCGTNRNTEQCACEDAAVDPRLADLADIRKKL